MWWCTGGKPTARGGRWPISSTAIRRRHRYSAAPRSSRVSCEGRVKPCPSPPQRREGRASALGEALDPGRDSGEGLVKLGGILTAGLGEIGAATAATAHEL